MRPFPVLWICGPSGVGKSSAGYELFDQLTKTGTPSAYVDMDQIGLSYPVPAGDPRNHRLRSRALDHVCAGFRAAGAQCLVVSGLADDLTQIPGTELTVCRLRASPAQLRDRITRRGWQLHLTEDALRDASELDGTTFADLVVDTTALTVEEVAAQIRATGWPGHAPLLPPPLPSPVTTSTASVPVLWLCGPPAVGKSTAGFTVFMEIIGEGVPVAYLDLAQLGFNRPGDPDQHHLKADLLGRLWPELHAAGARRLIITGGVTEQPDVNRYREAIPSGNWTVCRLTAGPAALTERTLLRGEGGGPPIPGDELRGRPTAELAECAAASARIGESLERAGIGDVSVDTDNRTVAEVAALVRAATSF